AGYQRRHRRVGRRFYRVNRFSLSCGRKSRKGNAGQRTGAQRGGSMGGPSGQVFPFGLNATGPQRGSGQKGRRKTRVRRSTNATPFRRKNDDAATVCGPEGIRHTALVERGA